MFAVRVRTFASKTKGSNMIKGVRGVFMQELEPKKIAPGSFNAVKKEAVPLTTYQWGFTSSDLQGKSAFVQQILSMENANGKELRKFNVKRAVDTFKQTSNDVGCVEVQLGVLSVKIASLYDHVLCNRKDHKTKRTLVQMLETRRKHLRYLKSLSLERYFAVLDKLNLKYPKPVNRTRPENLDLSQSLQ